MTKKLSAWLLTTFFLIFFLLPLAVRPLFIPDETRYAEVPREMVTSGDWVVPRINGLRYFEKPVMGYWMTALSLKIFGENNFAVRFPSPFSTGIIALFLFLTCSKFCTCNDRVPWIAVLVYLSSFGVMGIGTLALLDPPLAMFLTVTLILFFLATEERPRSGRERILLLAAGVFAGCAFLTKGFLAFAIPVLVAAPYLVFLGRWRDIPRLLPLPFIGAVLISLPWAILIHGQEPEFWNHFFWHEHVKRFLSKTAQHKQPFWFYLTTLPALFFPWILLLPAALHGLWQRSCSTNPEKRFFLFSLCWFFFPFLFFSASSGKLITYILPCLPPLAILFAMGIAHFIQAKKKQLIQWGIGLGALLTLLLFLTLAGLQLFGSDHVRLFHRSWKWILLCSILSAIFLLLVVAHNSKQSHKKIIIFASSFALLLFSVHFTMPVRTLTVKAPGPLLQRHAQNITADTLVFSGEEIARAVCWYLKRDDVYLVGRAGELQYGLSFKDSGRHLLRPEDVRVMILEHHGKAVLIVDVKDYSYWQPLLPPPVSVDTTGGDGYLFLHY